MKLDMLAQTQPKTTHTAKLLAFLAASLLVLAAAASAPVAHAQFTDVRVVGEGDTPREFFEPGDLVEIRGTAPQADALVALQVTNPQGTVLLLTTVRSAADGTFLKDFRLPTDAAEGEYTVSLTQGEFTATATFQVGPAAPPPPPPAAIQLVTAPTRVQTGEDITVSWTITGSGAIAHTAVHWDVEPRDPSDFRSYTQLTTEFARIDPPDQAPQNYTVSFEAPDEPGTIHWIVHAIVDGQHIYLGEERTITVTAPPAAPAAEVEALRGQVTELRGAVNRLNTELVNLQNTVEGLAADVESVREAAAHTEEETHDLEGSLAALQTEVSNVRSRVESVDQGVSALRGDVQSLSRAVEEIRAAPPQPAGPDPLAIGGIIVAVVAIALAGVSLARAGRKPAAAPQA